MENVHFYTYNVGHGVCTLLTGVKEDGSGMYCGIFDCGSKANNPIYDKSVILDDMEEKIREIGHIDDIVISHQDIDHNKYLFDLICKINGIEVNNKYVLVGKKNEYILEKRKQEGTHFLTFYIRDKKNSVQRAYVDVFYQYGAHKIFIDWGDNDLCFFSVTIFYGSEHEYDRHTLVIEVPLPSKYHPIGIYRFYVDKEENVVFFQAGDDDKLEELYTILSEITGGSINCKRILKEVTDGICSGETLQYLNSKIESDVHSINTKISNIVFGGGCREPRYMALISFMEYIGKKNYINVFQAEFGGYLELTYDTESNKENEKSIVQLSADGWHVDACIQTADNVYRNATSVVTNFSVGSDESISNMSILLPGDVTVHKLDYLNLKIGKSNKIDLFLAPHHGSDNSNFFWEDKKNRILLGETQPLYTLLKELTYCNIVFSAYNDKDAHPGCLFMEKTLEYAEKSAPKHSVIYGKPYDEYERPVACATFTTNYPDNETVLYYHQPYIEYFYNDYDENGNIIINSPKPHIPAPKRRLPPDSSFI